MPNLFDFLRLQNMFPPVQVGMDMPEQGGISGMMPRTGLFGPPQDPGLNPNVFKLPGNDFQVPQPETGGMNDISSMMQGMYTPEFGASDRFNDMLSMYPERPQPSGKRKFGAGVLGALTALGNTQGDRPSGVNPMDVYHEATGEGKFNREVTDWKNQIGPLNQAAQLERQTNANERIMAYQTAAQVLRERAQEAKERNDTRNAEIREHRASVYEFKALNPGMKFDFSGPTVKVADPISGEVKDTGIPTGSMSKMDQLNLQHDLRSAEIEQRGNIATELEGVKQGNRQTNIRLSGEEARKTKGALSGAGGRVGREGELPTQTKVRQAGKARELYNTRPDLRPFIKLGPSNEFEVIPPSKGKYWSSGPSDAQYKEMTDAIYGAGQPNIQQPGRTSNPPINQSKYKVTVK